MKIHDYEGKANIVGCNIRLFRKLLNLSQEELAAKMQLENIEMSQKSISRIEQQERLVTDYELLIFSRVLKTDVNLLLMPDSYSWL